MPGVSHIVTGSVHRVICILSSHMVKFNKLYLKYATQGQCTNATVGLEELMVEYSLE